MKKKNMVILIVFLCALLLIVLVLKKKEKGERIRTQKAEIAKKEKIILKIKDLVIEPERPISSSIIRAIPSLEKRPRGTFTYRYRWFVNGKEISNADCVLPESFRRKNNRVYCRVKALKDNVESKEKKSKEIVIANSPPVINAHQVKEFKVPGDFYHRIDAYDPDGDEIEFNLIAPLGMGIEVDRDSGEIRWSIPELPEPEEEEKKVEPYTRKEPRAGIVSEETSGEEGIISEDPQDETDKSDKTRVLIVVEVKDSDGATTKVSLQLDLKKGREIAD